MATRIKELTVVSGQGVKCYEVGKKINGLLIDKIEECSEFSDNFFIPIYKGITKDNDTVFEVINAPIDVEYGPLNEAD